MLRLSGERGVWQGRLINISRIFDLVNAPGTGVTEFSRLYSSPFGGLRKSIETNKWLPIRSNSPTKRLRNQIFP
jgi:hypothetical protein